MTKKHSPYTFIYIFVRILTILIINYEKIDSYPFYYPTYDILLYF